MSKLGISSLFKIILLTAALAVLSTTSASTEDTDYMALEKSVPNVDKTLTKVFSYTCPFCYEYNKAVIGPVSGKVKDAVALTLFHLEAKDGYDKQASEVFVVLINKNKAAGISLFDASSQSRKTKSAYHAVYHGRKERRFDGKDPAASIETGSDVAGVSQADFEATLRGPAVQGTLKKWKASYDVAKIQGVPAHVINDKYSIYTRSIKSTDAMTDLIHELANK